LATEDVVAAGEVTGELEDVEAALATRTSNDLGLANEIRATRASLCAKQGFQSHEWAQCEDFMRKACIPDKDSSAVTALLPEDLCRNFFLVEARETLPKFAPAPAPADAMSPGSAPGPSAVPMGIPSPAKAHVPWFSKMQRDLPEQGYVGDLVDHEDAESQTADWGEEFGPDAGHRSFRDICGDFPNNEWCRMHMKYKAADRPMGWERERPASMEEGDESSSSQSLLLHRAERSRAGRAYVSHACNTVVMALLAALTSLS